MLRFKYVSSFLIVFLLGISSVHADDFDSVYSLRGLGISRYVVGPQATGMGGVSLSLLDPRYLNTLNPAQFGALLDVRTSASFLFQRLNVSANEGNFKSYYSNFNSMAAGFPIKRNIGIQFGIVPETVSQFRLESAEHIGDVTYTKSVEKKGGMNTFYLGTGFRILPHIYLGTRVDFLFGKIAEIWKLDFTDPTFRDGKNTYNTKVWGLNAGVGALIRPAHWLSVGASYWPTRTMHMRLEQRYSQPQIITSTSKDWTYPSKYGVGFSVKLKNRWLFGADYWAQQWSKFAINGQADPDMTDERRLSLGAELGGNKDVFSPFLKQISLRAGFYTHTLNVLGFQGNEKVIENVGTFGFGFPFGKGRGSIDFAFEAGMRGHLSANSYKESIFRLKIFVTGGERWFVRVKK
ncbi:MAG: hypothetical protein GXO76_09010 [Calditrichaeota bacterium]|nr:hypothetical protein [Calditrichota bacterium]